MLNTSLITPEMNNVLCDLERINYMLMVANKQYRACQSDNVSEQTRRYFDKKLDFLSEYYNGLVGEIKKYYSNKRYEDSKFINERTEQFRDVFLRQYPECEGKFEDKFDVFGNSKYFPFQEDFYKFSLGQPTLKDESVYYAYINFVSSKLVSVQYDNFFELLNGITEQINEYGVKPVWGQQLSKNLKEVPAWVISNINDIANDKKLEVKSNLRKLAMQNLNLKKMVKKNGSDPISVAKYKESERKIFDLENEISLNNDIIAGSNNPAHRADCLNSAWRFRDTGLLSIVDNISKCVNNVPKHILKIDEERTKLIVTVGEANDIVKYAKYQLDTLGPTLVLAKASNIPVSFQLKDYEYSKNAIMFIDSMYKSNITRNVELNEQLKNNKLKPKQIKEIKSELDKINDCISSYDIAKFVTPYGVVKYNNGQLINTLNNQPISISKLDNYRCVNGTTMEKLDRDGVVIERGQVKNIEKLLKDVYARYRNSCKEM